MLPIHPLTLCFPQSSLSLFLRSHNKKVLYGSSNGVFSARYFFGKILSVDDLTTEHSYFLEKQRLRNQLVFGDGIVSGLSVAVGKEGSSQRVVLSPGLAIDPTGNEICVRDVIICALPPSG